MSFEEITLWLVMAMSVTAVAFLCWTLVAIFRRSGGSPFSSEPQGGASLGELTPQDPESA